MKKKIKLFPVIALLAIAGCNQSVENSNLKDSADAIYYDGDIITMEGDNAEYAEAVAIKDGKILFVGDMATAMNLKGDSTKMHDLEESLKESISQGKLADLVILDKNPLKVEPVAIKDIIVLETLKEGNTIYKKV